MGMKQILVMMAVLVLVVGCGKKNDGNTDVANPEKLITDPIVEKAVREELEKPQGELTEADLEKVTYLELIGTQFTDAGLKNLVKLKRLESLWLSDTQITDAGVAELKKALPNCEINGP